MTLVLRIGNRPLVLSRLATTRTLTFGQNDRHRLPPLQLITNPRIWLQFKQMIQKWSDRKYNSVCETLCQTYVLEDIAVKPTRLDNLNNKLHEAKSANCSVCRDLLINMKQFFDMLQDTHRVIAPDWLTVDDIASELKVSKSIVYRLIRSGELQAVNIVDTGNRIPTKGHYRVKRSSLQNYLEIKKVRPLPAAPNRNHGPRQFPKVKNHLGI